MRRLIDTPSTFAPQEVWQDFLADMQRLHVTDPADQQVVEAIAEANAAPLQQDRTGLRFTDGR